jgi:hypothetical protein
MHALIITFKSTADEKQLQAVAVEFAAMLRNVTGLSSKVWLADGAIQGGFYLFADRATAQGYLSGPLVGALRANPAFSDFTVREFAVNPELSACTGVTLKDSGQW